VKTEESEETVARNSEKRNVPKMIKIRKFVKDSLQSLNKTPEEYEYASLERNADQKLGFIKTTALIR
jgi:hypothetical protein